MLITGPAGAGKSQTAAAWADRGDGPRAAIDVDRLRLHVRAGFLHPEDGWSDEMQRQWDVATEIWQAMARAYRKHGIDCVVDVYAPPWPDSEFEALLEDLKIVRIILLPTLETCIERNRVRANQPLMTDHQVADNYEGFVEGICEAHRPYMIDNSQLTLDGTVSAVEGILARA